MDPPAASSCMRNSHPTTALWGCLRNHHAEAGGTVGPHHYPQAPFSFHHKPDFGIYSDFSTSCPAAALQSLPRDERAFEGNHPSFQPSAWHFAASEGRRRLAAELALGSGEPENRGSPHLMDAAIGTSEDYVLAVNVVSETEKKTSRRKKGNAGQSMVSEPEDEMETREGGTAIVTPGSQHGGHGLGCLPKLRIAPYMVTQKVWTNLLAYHHQPRSYAPLRLSNVSLS
ncbi:homeobox protein MOX-1 isoform X2 [Rhineura floridana]|uniref:homeobox protein MOX-1 isoform X2 n=1 Tax=Rhineura floridana TaxID=261503 RepID=UPI002AC84D45|nr:homeobox protein MOX-1 isoform X2 [Rhineura floridana]